MRGYWQDIDLSIKERAPGVNATAWSVDPFLYSFLHSGSYTDHTGDVN